MIPLNQRTIEHTRRTATLPGMTHAELLTECRAKEDELMLAAAELLSLAEALWPVGDSERPADLDDAGVTAAELVAGIQSLHEYCGRLLDENMALRAARSGASK